MGLRGSIALGLGRSVPTLHRVLGAGERGPMLWLVAVTTWLPTAPVSGARQFAETETHAHLRVAQRDLSDEDVRRIAAWTRELGAAATGSDGDATVLWAAVSSWDDAGGVWTRFARAIERLAAELDRNVASTARAAMALRLHMDEVEARLWGRATS